MIRRMQRQALVDIGQDKRIRLTKTGLEGAEDIARRHRLAEWLVVRLLGMELHQAHNEAHRLEHGMSPEFEEKLVERLNNPTYSPFGRPIPGSGEPRMPANSLTLDAATPDVTYVVARIPEEDPELLRFLVDSMIVPDHEVKVVGAAPYLGVLQVLTQQGACVNRLQCGPSDLGPQPIRRLIYPSASRVRRTMAQPSVMLRPGIGGISPSRFTLINTNTGPGCAIASSRPSSNSSSLSN